MPEVESKDEAYKLNFDFDSDANSNVKKGVYKTDLKDYLSKESYAVLQEYLAKYEQEEAEGNESLDETYSIEKQDPNDLALFELSPWERWRLKKKFEEEKMKEIKKAQEKMELLMKEKDDKQKIDKEIKQNEELRKWVQRKRAEAVKAITEKRTKEELEEQRKLKEKEHMKKLRAGKYNEFWDKIRKEEEMRKLREEQKKQIEEQERQMKREKSEKAFREWCEKVKDRPKTSQYGYGYGNGKCLKYYDWSTNPQPTFVNPIPWRPIEIPPTKTIPKTARNTNNKKPKTTTTRTVQLMTERRARSCTRCIY